MGLKVPGIADRIRALFSERLEQKAVLQVSGEVGIYQQKLDKWLKGTQPDYDGLVALERITGVPWQLILIGDEGYEAIRAFKDTKRGKGLRRLGGQLPEPAHKKSKSGGAPG